MTQPAPTPTQPPRRARVAALIAALLIGALLALTAYAKAFHPSPKPVAIEGTSIVIDGPAFDRGVAGLEIVVGILLLALHRWWGAWILSSFFFAALAGYSFFKSHHGESCGCFSQMFDPPPYSMFTVDVVITMASLILAVALRAPRFVLPVAFMGILISAGAGWAASDATTPPRRAETAAQHGNKLAHTRLLESDLLKDIRDQEPGGAAWMICAFDPTCHICEAMKPLIEFKRDELAETDDPILRVRIFMIPELHKETGIEPFAWETPTVFIISDGKIVKLWSGKVLENYTPERFQEVYDTLAGGGYPPGDAPPMYAEIKAK